MAFERWWLSVHGDQGDPLLPEATELDEVLLQDLRQAERDQKAARNGVEKL